MAVIAEVWILELFPTAGVAGITATLPLFFGPAFYQYVQIISRGAPPTNFFVSGHYRLPVLISLLYWMSFSMTGPQLPWLLPVMKLLSLYGYLIAAIRLLNNAPDLLRHRLRQSASIFLGLVTLSMCLFLAESIGYQVWVGSDLLAAISLALFIYGAGLTVVLDWQQFICHLQPAYSAHDPATQAAQSTSAPAMRNEPAPIQSPRTAILDSDTARQVYQAIYDTVQQQQLWREPQFRLASLAQATGFAEHYLSYVINQQAGCNSQMWLNKFRVEEAKSQLSQTDAAVLDIALQAGFNSKSTFNRVFKEISGVSPTEYRQQHRLL